MLIAVAMVLVVIISLSGVLSATSVAFTDSMCTFNAGLRDVFFGTPMWFCVENEVVIEADDFGACDPGGEKGWEEGYDEEETNKYLRWCTTNQFYFYANRCWERYGSGGLDLSLTETGQAYQCYKVIVEGLENDDYIFVGPGLLEARGDFREDGNIRLFDKSLKKDDLRIRGALENEGNGVYSVYYYEGLEGSLVWINVWPNPTI
jgi:hypothetical protein